MVLNVQSDHMTYWERGRRGEKEYKGEERGRLYTCRYTVTTRMIPGLRWAAMRAILMIHYL